MVIAVCGEDAVAGHAKLPWSGTHDSRNLIRFGEPYTVSESVSIKRGDHLRKHRRAQLSARRRKNLISHRSASCGHDWKKEGLPASHSRSVNPSRVP